eukprot:4133448-Amphidinium_carterae.2
MNLINKSSSCYCRCFPLVRSYNVIFADDDDDDDEASLRMMMMTMMIDADAGDENEDDAGKYVVQMLLSLQKLSTQGGGPRPSSV